MDIIPQTSESVASDTLRRICAQKREEVARHRAATPLGTLKARLDGPTRGFYAALKEATGAGRIGLIAEIKKASPSGGLIRPDFDPPALARAYREGGATCLSVLTEATNFQGDPAHLRAARAAVDLPVLRKDFILDPWQVYESRAMGADCILLILAALSDQQALELESLARALDLDVLAEVHDRAELDRALGLQTPMIGINNRNLKTLKTTLETTLELAPHVPPERFLVAESGIKTASDLRRLTATGTQCFLVGEMLLRQADVGAAARALIAGARS